MTAWIVGFADALLPRARREPDLVGLPRAGLRGGVSRLVA